MLNKLIHCQKSYDKKTFRPRCFSQTLKKEITPNLAQMFSENRGRNPYSETCNLNTKPDKANFFLKKKENTY